MADRLKTRICALICALILVLAPFTVAVSADTQAYITDFTSLMSAVSNAKDGDTITVGDIDFTPLSPDIPYSMMVITVDKSITLRGANADSAAVFKNGGFILSGSKLSGEKISVKFENIVFDGLADYEGMSEKDFEYPWDEVAQTYRHTVPLRAQQALSFSGNVSAEFSGCVFKNYMHEYGPVIDIRYGDYTNNEYLSQIFADYSGCRIDLNFDGCRIENNSALYDGGAIYIESNNNVFFNATSCVFSGNRSTMGEFSRGGGAIFASGAILDFADCRFDNNVANHYYQDTPSVDYDTHKGGAIIFEACKLNFVNTEFKENEASLGGAVSMTNTKGEFDGCRFLQNRVETVSVNPNGMEGPRSNISMGGAIYIEGNSNDTVTMINCTVKDNSAAMAYGAIYGYYVPFEDPSFGTYILNMAFCSFEGNNDDVNYDYSTVGDLLWMSHPGDMFSNPHISLFGCYIVDETFEADFPRDERPSEENGYNYISSVADESVKAFTVPTEKAKEVIGERYGGRLTEAHIGSNYSNALYHPEEEVSSEESSEPSYSEPAEEETRDYTVWWAVGICAATVLIGAGVVIFHISRKRSESEETEAYTEEEKPHIVMTRYDDAEIDRFIALLPESQTLTSRELEVLREIMHGKKQSEVAMHLGIKVTTVKDFYKKIYAKLNVENKDELFVLAEKTLNK